MLTSIWGERRRALGSAQAAKPGEDVVVRFGARVPVVAFRFNAFPELDFLLSDFDPAAAPDAVEAALRRFLQERVRRQG